MAATLTTLEILHTKYYQLRKKILGLSVIILLLLFFLLKYFIPDYLIWEKELKIDSGIIQYAFMNKYKQYEQWKGIVYKSCLDVVLVGKPYFIRFNDQLDKKYWATIRDTNNFSKSIEIKFQPRVLHDGILYNPNEVLIDGKVIIPADSKKSVIGWAIIVFGTGLIGCIYFFKRLWGLYKEGLYWQDKQTAEESKWKLISAWIND